MNASETYERALDQLLRFKPEVVDLAGTLITEHPEFAMGHALMAYLCLIATDVPELPPARAAHTAMVAVPLDERETAHAAAIGAWLAGDWNRASAVLDELLRDWPTDVLALQVGHQLDFFLGDRATCAIVRHGRSKHSIAAIREPPPCAACTPSVSRRPATTSAAEEVGMSAIEVHPDDVWAIHAVVHTMEMRGLVDRGIPFLRGRVDDWGDGNLFTVAQLVAPVAVRARGRTPRRGARHLRPTSHNAEAAGVPLEMLDASALLWRLVLDGVDSGTRFAELADAWASRTSDEPWYVFNDVHAAMAFAGAGRLDDVKAVIAKLEADVSDDSRTNTRMTADVGLPAARAVLAYAEDRHDDVVDTLAPIRRTLHHFGGSHAQRDVLQRTLLESALRSGRFEFADELLSERLGERETSVYGWTRRQRLLSEIGEAAAAEVAADAGRRAAVALRHRLTAFRRRKRSLRAGAPAQGPLPPHPRRDCDTPSSSWGHDLLHSLCRMSGPWAGAVPHVPVRAHRTSGAGRAARDRCRHRLQRARPQRVARAQVSEPTPRRRPRRRASRRRVSPVAPPTSTSSPGRRRVARAGGAAVSTRPSCSPAASLPTSGCPAGDYSNVTEQRRRRPAAVGASDCPVRASVCTRERRDAASSSSTTSSPPAPPSTRPHARCSAAVPPRWSSLPLQQHPTAFCRSDEWPRIAAGDRRGAVTIERTATT